ncbi:MAG: hypothetical protein AAGF99_06870 [Bacteroidota bacterium]
MELLPILSTIILVGTLATLILAVAAYVLYKVRERQGRGAPAPPPAAPPQPLLLTAPAGGAQGENPQVAQLQELLRLAAAGLQQQSVPNALPPAAHDASPAQSSSSEGWSAPTSPSAPAAPPPEPTWEDATFEDVTPLRAGDLADFFGEELPEPTLPPGLSPLPLPAAPPSTPPTPPQRSVAAPRRPERRPEPVQREQPAAPAPQRPPPQHPAPPRSTPPRTMPQPSAPLRPAPKSSAPAPPSAKPPAAASPRPSTPAQDDRTKEGDYQELLRLADELDSLFDLDAPDAAPPPRDDRSSWD